jgi:ABC-type bacteriocin/lantibiotic exporter with double-glycine peptidase domain
MLISGRLRSAYALYGRSLGELGLEMTNSAADPGEIAILGAQPQRSRRFAQQLRQVAAVRLTAALRLQAARQFHASLPVFVQVGFLVYGTYLLLEAGGANPGGILAIYYFAPAVVRPVQNILDAYLQVSANWGLIAQAGEILDASAARPAATAGTAGCERAAEIELGDVCYAPGPEAVPLLRELSHVFKAGSASAVVGRSGSGKSTLLSLIAGLRAPAQGTVLVDGVAPQAARLAAPGTIALVSQTPLIITDTVRENFRLACDAAPDAEIERVCREVGLWPILETLAPHAPLDTMLSPAPGQGLSGGARRLLAVARVLLVKPRVLLLDEPTTGVDALGLEALLKCLQRVAREATLVIVEHNIEFVWSLVGTICCLEDGRFTDAGAASELANRPGLFQLMLRSRAALLATDRMSIESVPLPTLAAAVPAPRPEPVTA